MAIFGNIIALEIIANQSRIEGIKEGTPSH